MKRKKVHPTHNLDLPEGTLKILRKHGIHTVEYLAERLAAGLQLTIFDGIGNTRAREILNALNAFYETEPEPVPQEATDGEQVRVPVYIDMDLYNRVADVLVRQGSTVEKLVTLHLTAFAHTRVRYGLRDLMWFGKYRGAVIEDVARTDLPYMTFVMGLENIIGKFAPEVTELVAGLSEMGARGCDR